MLPTMHPRPALRPRCLASGGALGRAALALLLLSAVGLTPVPGESTDPNRPVSSEDATSTEQPAVSQGVAGVVVATSGAPIADVFVQAVPADAAAGPVPEIAIVTDERGRYHWPLPPGRYLLSVAPAGFGAQVKEVVIAPQRLADLNFVVEPAR